MNKKKTAKMTTRLKEIDPYAFQAKINTLWNRQYLLLAAGDFKAGRFNTMTVAWGMLGIMWNKPYAMIVVRPSRYTFSFLNRYPDFTLSAFPEKFSNDLTLLGTKSGRDGNKLAETALHPVPSHHVAAPAFAEAELVIECRKMYWNDLISENFTDQSIYRKHEIRNSHRLYFGEIVALRGVEKYC